MSGFQSVSKDLETFYLLLWLHGGGGQQEPGHESERLRVNIPHTVFIKYGNPSVWYFTAKSGCIMKKSEGNLTFSNIWKEFSAIKPKNPEICANLYSFDSEDKTKIDYLSWEELESICQNPEDARKSDRFRNNFYVLQSHIEGGTLYNSVLECMWSENFVLLRQIRNIVPISSHKHHITDRLMTFDAPEHCAQIGTLSLIQKRCEIPIQYQSQNKR